MIDKEKLLEILEDNCSKPVEDIAIMLDCSVEEVSGAIDELRAEGVILGFNATVNWEKFGRETVEALIEVHITPQRDQGFDKIAERIYRFPEVKECYLMSGGYDLKVIVEGSSMREIAAFVTQKLSAVENVIGTGTHFVLKKYKEKGIIYASGGTLDREAIVL